MAKDPTISNRQAVRHSNPYTSTFSEFLHLCYARVILVVDCFVNYVFRFYILYRFWLFLCALVIVFSGLLFDQRRVDIIDPGGVEHGCPRQVIHLPPV